MRSLQALSDCRLSPVTCRVFISFSMSTIDVCDAIIVRTVFAEMSPFELPRRYLVGVGLYFCRPTFCRCKAYIFVNHPSINFINTVLQHNE